MSDMIKNQKEAIARLALEDPQVLSGLFGDLEGTSRRKRQSAASMLSMVASTEPKVVADRIDLFIDALDRPEAQTRWECLDALTALVESDPSGCDKAVSGAESALFDEDSGPLRLAAMRFLCRLGATSEGRSQKTWPLIDEAIQCYHGDLEFQDMLIAVIGFSSGSIADDVAQALTERMSFDAKNGRGILKKRAQQILDNLSA